MINPEEFVKIWQASATMAEVAKRTKMARGAVSSRACVYRKKGVPLKRMGRNGPRIDWTSLAALAESLNGKGKKR